MQLLPSSWRVGEAARVHYRACCGASAGMASAQNRKHRNAQVAHEFHATSTQGTETLKEGSPAGGWYGFAQDGNASRASVQAGRHYHRSDVECRRMAGPLGPRIPGRAGPEET